MAASTSAESPPVFLPAPIPNYYLPENFWCSAAGLSALSGLPVRISFYLHALSLFIAWLFAPSSQPYIATSLSILIISLCPILLSHTTDKFQTVIGPHPIALEHFLLSFPAWMCLLLTSPSGIPRLNTHSNLGMTVLSFLAQSCAVVLLAGVAVYVMLFPGEIWKTGMDFRQYTVTREHQNANYYWGPDISESQVLYRGENICGRRIAIFGGIEVKLESLAWRGLNGAIGIISLAIWMVVSAGWIKKMLRYLYISKSIHRKRQSSGSLLGESVPFWANSWRRRNSSRAILNLSTGNEDRNICHPIEIAIEDTLPFLSSLGPLFKDGTVPPRISILPYIRASPNPPRNGPLSTASRDQETLDNAFRPFKLQTKPGLISTFLMHSLNFQLPILDPFKDHFRSAHGLLNKMNFPWFSLVPKILLFILVPLSVEKTITHYHVIYDPQEIWGSNGALSLGLGVASLLASLLGWGAEILWWRLVGFIAERAANGREMLQFGESGYSHRNGDVFSSPVIGRLNLGVGRGNESRFRDVDFGP